MNNKQTFNFDIIHAPLADLPDRLEKIWASQIAASVYTPEKGAYEGEIYVTERFNKLQELAQAGVEIGKDQIAVRGYFWFEGVKIITATKRILDLLHDQDALNQIAKAQETVKDDLTGKRAHNAVMIAKAEAAMIRYGNRWKNIGIEGYMPFGVNPKTRMVYTTGFDTDGRMKDVYIGDWNHEMQTMSWRRIATTDFISEVGRPIVAPDGKCFVDVRFENGTTSLLSINADGTVVWSKPTKEQTVIAPLFSRGDKKDVLGLVAYADDTHRKVDFIPPKAFTQRQQDYAKAALQAI